MKGGDSASEWSPERRLGVLHLTDTLIAAGYERVAVNLANALPVDKYRAHLCTTRREGPLARCVAPHVGRLRLMRRWSFDPAALRRLVVYLRENRIEILHAHGTTVFIAAAASCFRPRPAVIWHNHAGRLAASRRRWTRWRLASRRVDATITVSDELRNWCIQTVGLPADRVWFIPNAVPPPAESTSPCSLPGADGSRIVSVAHLLPDKDPLTLIRAMKRVAAAVPTAHLLMVGAPGDPAYMALVRSELDDPVLAGRVTQLGLRGDVGSILKSCDVGVLSSVTEGFPVALLEYGLAGLPAVATAVGQCADILGGGSLGLVVPPAAPGELAEAILSLLASPARRRELGERFQRSVRERYDLKATLEQIGKVYAAALEARNQRRHPEPSADRVG